MKIIISHDVDHLTWHEHWIRDFFIPKFLARQVALALHGHIPYWLFLKRIIEPARNHINNLKELVALNREQNIPATFFIAMNRGLGIAYSRRQAIQTIYWLIEQGFATGVHGNTPSMRQENIVDEYENFAKITGGEYNFGIRNHYLRKNHVFLNQAEQAGYVFDSTESGLKRSRILNSGLIEFPVCLMDVYLMRQVNHDLEQAKNKTVETLQAAESAKLDYFTIDTHDIYFSTLFPEYKAWYEWLILYIQSRYETIDFLSAARETKNLIRA